MTGEIDSRVIDPAAELVLEWTYLDVMKIHAVTIVSHGCPAGCRTTEDGSVAADWFSHPFAYGLFAPNGLGDPWKTEEEAA
jgi:hypothetical protein